jgi:hypothetical protein
MELDTTKWSGEGAFTQTLIDALRDVPVVAFVRVEDAPATRSEADYNFISNEVFVRFADEARVEAGRRFVLIPVRHTVRHKLMDMAGLEAALTAHAAVGAPDYVDEGMIQYLRSERIIPPYQTRGYKLVELVRIYEIAPT